MNECVFLPNFRDQQTALPIPMSLQPQANSRDQEAVGSLHLEPSPAASKQAAGIQLPFNRKELAPDHGPCAPPRQKQTKKSANGRMGASAKGVRVLVMSPLEFETKVMQLHALLFDKTVTR